MVVHGRNRTSCPEGEALQASVGTNLPYCADHLLLVDCQGVEPRMSETDDLQSSAVASAARNPHLFLPQ